ncbi:Hypothetical predicted protein [Paramuricea clavata]|uniref:Uncharacterized protein n=1 Tax=Paramuricea clavata TaxID=317549 RepID=A0A7D9IW03_PARCT|nr:Hypothetical predicted protein [Paramuricea clavata]
MADPTSDAETHKTFESVVSSQIEGQAKVQENDSNIENGRQGRNHFGNKLRILIRSDRVDIFLKVLGLCLALDVNHIVIPSHSYRSSESQEVKLPNRQSKEGFQKRPRWFVNIFTPDFVGILRYSNLYNQIRKDERDNFSSYIPLASCYRPAYLLFELSASRTLDKSKSIPFHFAMVERLSDQKFKFYHLLHFVEVTSKVASIMLDVALEVAPLIQHNFPDESRKFRGLVVIVIGFRLAFHLRILSFFWQKLFHGEKDLFSEPNEKLVYEPLLGQKQQHDELEKTVQLEEVICT